MFHLYSASGWVDTVFDPQKNLILVKWLNYTSKTHVRECLKAQLNAIEKFSVKTIIVDSSEVIGLPYPEDFDWFENILFPESKKFGLERVIIIYPKNPLSKLVTRRWVDLGEKFDLKFLEVESMEEAMEMVKDDLKNKEIAKGSFDRLA